MMGWLIAAGVFILIAILPVGIRFCYDSAGAVLWLLFGRIPIKLFPRNKKSAKTKENKKNPKQTNTAENNEDKKEKTEDTNKGGKLTDFLPLVKTALAFLNSFRRKIRINNLSFNLILAADDPCDLAVNYGKVWTAIGNLFPLLEQVFVIKKRKVQTQCDFEADTTRIIARIDLTITIGRLLGIVVKYGVKAIFQYFKIMNLRKGGADA